MSGNDQYLHDSFGECPMCGKQLWMMAKVTIKVPGNITRIDKTTFRTSLVQIWHVERPNPSVWVCDDHGLLIDIMKEMGKQGIDK